MRTATKRPRTKPPEERHDELMNAAQRLFLKQGVGPTTIEEITSGADVAKGTFYLYFTSKEDLLAALRERFAEELLSKVKTAVAKKSEQDWQGKLATWAKAITAAYLDANRLHEVVFYESRPSTREGLTNNILIDHLSELLQAGVEAGAWSIDNPGFTAVFLFSGLHGVVDDAQFRRKQIDRTRLAHGLERICARAVGLS